MRFIELGSQGAINAMITKLISKPEQLKEFMADKTDEQKIQGRIHAKTIMALIKKGKK